MRAPDLFSGRAISRREFLRQSTQVILDPRATALNVLLSQTAIPLRPFVLKADDSDSIEIAIDSTSDPRYVDEDGDFTDLYDDEVFQPIRRAMRLVIGQEEEEYVIWATYRSRPQ